MGRLRISTRSRPVKDVGILFCLFPYNGELDEEGGEMRERGRVGRKGQQAKTTNTKKMSTRQAVGLDIYESREEVVAQQLLMVNPS